MEKAGFEYERDVVQAGSPHVLFLIKFNVRVKETGTPMRLCRPR
jgi:hypothetical protein